MAKGKYAGIIDKLPRSLGTEPDYQDKVNAIKREVLAIPSDSQEPTAEISSAVLEELVMDATALLSVINDSLIKSVGGRVQAARLARVFRDIRIVKDALEEQEKTLNAILEAYKQLLVNQYEAEGTTSIALDDGGTIRVQPEPHARVVDKVANRIWAIENGYENMLALPWQTVNAIAKESALKGEEAPAGVELERRDKVVFSKN
jgi:hypothetical protein